MRRIARVVLLALGLLANATVVAEVARIAVATNFLRPLEALTDAVAAATGHRYELVGGSTGKLYAQIVRGAPYDLFLAADQARPARLDADGLTVPGTRRTYALGELLYWTAQSDRSERWLDSQLDDPQQRIAIANERLAPYGSAALQVLERRDRPTAASLLRGENVGHAFTLVATGHAAVGLVAASALVLHGGGTRWSVPAGSHDPIRQDLVLLARAETNAAARALLDWLVRAWRTARSVA